MGQFNAGVLGRFAYGKQKHPDVSSRVLGPIDPAKEGLVCRNVVATNRKLVNLFREAVIKGPLVTHNHIKEQLCLGQKGTEHGEFCIGW